MQRHKLRPWKPQQNETIQPLEVTVAYCIKTSWGLFLCILNVLVSRILPPVKMVPKTKDWSVLSLVCWSINARLSAKTSNDWGHRLIAALFLLLFLFYFVSFKKMFYYFVCWNKQMDKQNKLSNIIKRKVDWEFYQQKRQPYIPKLTSVSSQKICTSTQIFVLDFYFT